MKTQSQSFRPLSIDIAPAHTPRQLYAGIFLAMIGAALFALKGIFIKLAYGANPELEALTLLAIRMGLAMPVYILILLWALKRRNKPEALTRKHFVVAGALGLTGYYLAAYLDFSGLQYVSAQLERLILYTYPVFVMILGALFFGKSMSARGFAAMLISYGGLALIFARGSIASGEDVVFGAALVVGAALSFAVFQLLAARQIKIVGSAVFTCVAMISAGTGILTHFTLDSIVSGGFEKILSQPRTVWLVGGMIALFSTLIPSFLINVALGRIGAQAVAVVSMISPLVTIILAVAVLGETFGLYDALGTGLTVFGIGLFTWYERKPSDTVIKGS